MSHKSLKEFFLGFLLGGTVGALLFKTERGKKIQKTFLKQCHKISDQSHDLISKATKEKRTTKRKSKGGKQAPKRKKKT